MGGMRATPPAARAYLDVLELARPSLAFVQDEMAGRYAQTALPPGSLEDETLRRVVTLWQAMARGYAQVAQLGADDPAGAESTRAHLPALRPLQRQGDRRVFPRPARAAARPVERCCTAITRPRRSGTSLAIEVADPAQRVAAQAKLRPGVCRSPAAGHRQPLRPQRRGNSAGWCAGASASPPFADVLAGGRRPAATATYAVDLLKDRGLLPVEIARTQRASEATGDDTVERRKCTRLVGELKRRTAAGQLGLGEDCSRAGLLAAAGEPVPAVVPGGQTAPLSSGARRAATAQLCYGFEAIHFYVGGEEFVQPQHVRDLFAAAKWTPSGPSAIRSIRPSHLYVRAAQIGYTMENWAVADESADGFRLLRFGTGVRVEHGQLLGLRPPDGERFLLCQVSWLHVPRRRERWRSGCMCCPGRRRRSPRARSGLGLSPSERYSPAFLLPAMPALNQEPTAGSAQGLVPARPGGRNPHRPPLRGEADRRHEPRAPTSTASATRN
ncbi:MAG: hypothetical protein MZW92_77105 [Comamonadaceae bacterium]|nr:hypothetical protein [Comamonadaceae bacterium]